MKHKKITFAAAHLYAESFWWLQCSVGYIAPLPPLPRILVLPSNNYGPDIIVMIDCYVLVIIIIMEQFVKRLPCGSKR